MSRPLITATCALLSIAVAALVLFCRDIAPVTIVLFAFVVIYFGVLKRFDIWRRNIAFLLGGYFIFTKGFSYIGVSFGGFSIFIGEIVILASLLLRDLVRPLKALAHNGVAKLAGVWFLFGCALAAMNIGKYSLVGIFKDLATVYYSVFILFGYAFFDGFKKLDAFFKYLGFVFITHMIWCFFYPFRESIMAASPKLMGFMPFFCFRNDADSVIFIGAILYFLLLSEQLHWRRTLSAVFVIVNIILLFVFKMSAGYIACAIALTYILAVKRELVALKISTIFIVTVLVVLVSILGYQAVSDKQSLGLIDIMADEINTVIHYSRSDTSTFRLFWWKDIVKTAIADPMAAFLGRGFGPSLVMGEYSKSGDWSRAGEEIGGLSKSPHSIEITLLARTGVTGLLLWIIMNLSFFLYLFRGIRIAADAKLADRRNILIWIAAFQIAIVAASSVGVLLESPFMAIPYFFFMGFGLALTEEVKSECRKTIASGASG